MKRVIKHAYKRVDTPLDYKVQLLNKLVYLGDVLMVDRSRSLLKRPGFWVLVAAVIIISIIIYGLWLSTNITI